MRQIKSGEHRAVVLSAAYFFCLLSSYYLLRPVRDEMGIRGGVDQLQWLFTATFLTMLAAVPLFGWASGRWPRQRLIPVVYLFFVASLLAFYVLLQGESRWVPRAFYVWVSVYNLFVVSVFWSFMADLSSQEQGKRLFGIIAAGGSAGAFCSFGKVFRGTLAALLGHAPLQSGHTIEGGEEVMKISIISGSHRDPSQSMKVARFIESVLRDKGLADETWLFGLGNNPLPLWDSGVWEGEARWKELLDPIRAELAGSDGLVVVSPEWHGQVPAGLKNLFLLLSRFEVGHKPALIVTVSSGDGGAYPVAELRMSSYKNNRICYIPEHVIVRNVESVLNDDPADNNPDADSYFRTRITWALGILREYAIALRQVRASGVTEHEMFKNGM